MVKAKNIQHISEILSQNKQMLTIIENLTKTR